MGFLRSRCTFWADCSLPLVEASHFPSRRCISCRQEVELVVWTFYLCGEPAPTSCWFLLFCLVWLWWLGAVTPPLTTGRSKRLPSPSWHRRLRKARSKARTRVRQGLERPGDRDLLEAHHGSMAPKPAADKSSAKVQSKGKGKGTDFPQSSKIEFALPPAMVTCLQAITARSTQDLWHSPAAVPADLTVEQQAQRRASAVGKLSKRLNGNLRAKEELGVALSTWTNNIGLHLAGLVQRVRALGEKVDADLAEACQDMRTALEAQPSLATEEQVTAALEAVGRPIWSYPQEQEMLRMAASLRAFSAVEPATRPVDTISEVSFGMAGAATAAPVLSPSRGIGGLRTTAIAANTAHFAVSGDSPPRPLPEAAAPMSSVGREGDSAVAVASLRAKRWRRRGESDASRPSKSPRREDVVGPPWSTSATGTTPEGAPRLQHTCIEESGDTTRPAAPPPLTWEAAWQQVLQFAVEQGATQVGEITRDAQQDAVLPLHDQCPEDRVELLATAEEIWEEMAAIANSTYRGVALSLCVRLQELLNRLRLCPSALSGVRQGTLLLAQVTVGNLLDPFSYRLQRRKSGSTQQR